MYFTTYLNYEIQLYDDLYEESINGIMDDFASMFDDKYSGPIEDKPRHC